MPTPTRCVACGGDDLHPMVPTAGGLTLRFGSFLHNAIIAGSVCLACGHVVMYLPEYELRKVRFWKAKQTSRRKPPG